MRSYDVAVVGAGLLGCATALHLMRLGVKRVALIDVGPPAGATSGAGAGFVGAWAAGYAAPGTCDANELALELYGIEFYRQLAEHHDVELRNNGSLFVAVTEQGWQQDVAAIATHSLAPAGTRELTPHQVQTISAGAISAASVFRAVLHPGGIQLDTTPTVQAMVAVLTELGADLLVGGAVTSLLHDDDRVTGVRLGQTVLAGARLDGTVSAGVTVLAAGAWTNALLGEVGAELPMAREVASRVISPPSGISASMPTVMVPEWNWLWAREHRGGLTYGNVSGYQLMHALGPVPAVGRRPHYRQLVDDMIADLTPNLGQLFPALDADTDQWRQGIVSHAPDRLFYAGAVPGVTGLFTVAGCNEGGVTHGPGLGRVVADLIVTGSTDFVDASRYRLDRFAGQQFDDEAAVARALPDFSETTISGYECRR